LRVVFPASITAHFNIPIWGSLTAFGVALAILTVMVLIEMYYVNNYVLAGKPDSGNKRGNKEEVGDVENVSQEHKLDETASSQIKDPGHTARSSETGREPTSDSPEKNPSKSEEYKEKLPFLVMSARPKWYYLMAGLIGMVYLTSGIVFTKYIGPTLFFLPTVVGQIIMSAAIDFQGDYDLSTVVCSLLTKTSMIIYTGIDKEAEPLTVRRLIVLAMTIVGVALVVAGTAQESIERSPLSVGWIVLLVLITFVVGLTIPVQTLLNRKVCAELTRGSFIQAIWWSFFEGFIVALLVLIVELCLDTNSARHFPARYADSEWYMYFGGALGLIYVYLGAVFTGLIGYEVYFISIITGQLVGTLLTSGFGFLTVKKLSIGPLPIIGAILVVLPLALHAAVPKRHDIIVWQKAKKEIDQRDADSKQQDGAGQTDVQQRDEPPRNARGLWSQQSEVHDSNLY
jgi:transporter family-2 protein